MEKHKQQKINGEQTLEIEFGKYLLDVSKLIFGGAVISGIMKQDISLAYILAVGIFSSFGLAVWGFTFIKQSKTR
jgi:hypothetical protein